LQGKKEENSHCSIEKDSTKGARRQGEMSRKKKRPRRRVPRLAKGGQVCEKRKEDV